MKKSKIGIIVLVVALIMTCVTMVACDNDTDKSQDDDSSLCFGLRSMTEFGVNGIGDCTDKELVIPNTYMGYSVVDIGERAFKDVDLTSVTVADSVVKIGFEAFFGCSALSCVNLSDGLEWIDDSAFYDCTELTDISIPETVTYIGSKAFEGCENLKYNVFDEVKYLGNDENPYMVLVAVNDKDIDAISIHEDTKIIYSYAFRDCKKITRIEIPDGVVQIGDGAFENCTEITHIDIPDSVEFIGKAVFKGCTNLEYNEYENARYLGNGGNPYVIFVDLEDEDAESLELPDGVRVIYSHSFAKRENVTSVILPDGVKSIGDEAFYGCANLASIHFPESLKYIGCGAFSYCYNLGNVRFDGSFEQWTNGMKREENTLKGDDWNNETEIRSISIPDGMIGL